MIKIASISYNNWLLFITYVVNNDKPIATYQGSREDGKGFIITETNNVNLVLDKLNKWTEINNAAQPKERFQNMFSLCFKNIILTTNYGLYKVIPDGNGVRDDRKLIAASEELAKLVDFCKINFNETPKMPDGTNQPVFEWAGWYEIEKYELNIV